MRLRISHPHLLPALLRFLAEHADTVAAQVGEDEVEVSILGSRRAEPNRLELDLRLGVWRARHPDVRVEVTA